MKRAERKVTVVWALILITIGSFAQTKLDEERMDRDIEVAENILSTMIKQQFDKNPMIAFAALAVAGLVLLVLGFICFICCCCCRER